MRGPMCAFRAEDVPTLYISAAYHLKDASHTTAQLFWEVDNEGGFREDQSVRFDIIPDGEFHTYEIDFTSFSTYRGLISQLRFDLSRGDRPAIMLTFGTSPFRKCRSRAEAFWC